MQDEVQRFNHKWTKQMIYIWKTDMGLASETVPSSSCSPLDMQWSRFGIWAMWAGPDTRYGLASMAKLLNSESVKKKAHNKWVKQLSSGVLRWETTRLHQQGPRHEVLICFRYYLHEGRYLRSLEWSG